MIYYVVVVIPHKLQFKLSNVIGTYVPSPLEGRGFRFRRSPKLVLNFRLSRFRYVPTPPG